MPRAIHHLAQAVCHRFPFLSGRGTLLQLPPLRWLRFAEERLQVPLAEGPCLVVFPNDFIGKSVYFFGDVDPKIPRTLARLLDEGDTLVDIGANIGLVSMQCLALVGPAGRVVAVEPQPQCCEALAETIAINGIDNLEVHQLALSDHDGQMTLHLPDASNFGMASLEPAGARTGIEVEVRQAGEFLASLRIDGEYVVKIDVEGHEGKVFAGLAPFFAVQPPKGIVFESHEHAYHGESFCDGRAYRTLRDAGFRVYQIPKSLTALKYTEVRPGEAMPQATDFVAVRPELVERLQSGRYEKLVRGTPVA